LAVAVIVPNSEGLAAFPGFEPGFFGGRPMLLGAASSAVALLAGLRLAVRPAARCALLALLVRRCCSLRAFGSDL
jgi:hypothetical protein